MSNPDKTGSPQPAVDLRTLETAESTPSYHGRPDDLHDLFPHTPANPDEEDPFAAMRNDPNYKLLMRDLEAIAEAAKELLKPAEEAPRDEVWQGIAEKLKSSSPDA